MLASRAKRTFNRGKSSTGDSEMSAETTPNDLESFWLPFTPNRQFKREPRLLSRAKDMHYYKPDGTPVLDATAGLWCSNAGHCREPIVKAIQAQAGELDFAPSFQRSEEHTLNSSHVKISYAVFCLKK